MSPIKNEISRLLSEAASGVLGSAVTVDEAALSLEGPRAEKFGDLSSHLALRLAKLSRRPAKPLAEEIKNKLEGLLPDVGLAGRIEKIAVEGTGFLNFYYTQKELISVLSRIKKEGVGFGRPAGVIPKKMLLEFVSANPTGPLTVAHGRQAALGDSLARILEFCGHRVTKEYYNNDEGVQVDTLGKSTELRVREIVEKKKIPLPENYYQGAYLVEIAQKILHELKKNEDFLKWSEEERLRRCRLFARNAVLEGIKRDLKDFDVVFDNYYSQETLVKSGKVEKALEELKKRQVVYEQDGALWLRATDFGDDKDRVLIKNDKSYTYLAPDVAYHHEKFERGFDEIINIWGPDHHGYIARLKASQTALGHDARRIHILIAQLVTLYDKGQQVRMSTRAGEFVTLREILDEVGKDAGRFFFTMRKFDAHLDFDLALAKTQTLENPVFYIQYAHARIESIKRTLSPAELSKAWVDEEALARLEAPSEIRLLRLLSAFAETVQAAERTLEPFRLIPYLQDLAGEFHKFYTDHRVMGDDKQLSRARLALVMGIQAVVRKGLELLGVSSPLKM